MRPDSLIALYHGVGTRETTGYRDAVSLEGLERQLDWLRRSYRVLPLEELLERRRKQQSLGGLAAITFDDNHRSILSAALPLLRALDLPATWFLIGQPLLGRPFWRDLVRRVEESGRSEAFVAFARARTPAAAALRPERLYRDSKDPVRIAAATAAALLEAFLPDAGAPADFVRLEELSGPPPAGLTLASHTAQHFVLAGLPEAIQYAEIREGQEILQRSPWPQSPLLALPFGDPETYDAATLAAARTAQLRGLLLTGPGLCAADDLSRHPLARGNRPPALVRCLLGRETLPAA